MRALAIAVVLACALPARPAAADVPRAAAIAERLSAGEKAYADQDYAAAIKTLLPVTRDPAATRAQRIHALELIALAQFIRRDEAAARDTFERILDIDPGYQLRDDSGSPRIREFFEQLKRQLVPGYGAAAELDHAAPSSATAGRRVEIDVHAVRGAAAVTDVAVYVRRRGELSYRAIAAAPHGEARWRAGWSLDPSRTAYDLDYYVEAHGPAGDAAGRIASPEDPLPLHVEPGGGERARWYTRWYVVAGAAVVVGGATTAAVFAAKGGAGPGSLSPGTITVTP